MALAGLLGLLNPAPENGLELENSAQRGGAVLGGVLLVLVGGALLASGLVARRRADQGNDGGEPVSDDVEHPA